MAETDGQEKSEKASDKKLKEGREKGQVAKSTEINSLALLTGGMLSIVMAKNYMGDKISSFTINSLSRLDNINMTPQIAADTVRNTIIQFGLILAPVVVTLTVAALVANISQVGFSFSSKALTPKFSKMNFFKNFKKLFFSSRSFIETAKSMIKLFIIGLFTYNILVDLTVKSTSLPVSSINYIVQFLLESVYSLVWKIVMVFFLIAAVDFLFQRFKHMKEMMMTKQEVKEESKQSDGDPHTKSRIRKIQLTLSRGRMIKEVPKADVVITNPTHYAIAIKYEMSKDKAPRVLATGVDETARRIKEIAVKNNIPLFEDRELARALYKVCKPGDVIPETLFKAVAKVLAYVFSLKNYKKKSIV